MIDYYFMVLLPWTHGHLDWLAYSRWTQAY